jgi:pimeloyl-ACP methyl ester carboxylesterase
MPTLPTSVVKLNSVQLGAGEDLVLIHGLGANISFWYFGAARLLSRRRSVLMYDLRGHGRSSTPQAGYGLAEMAGDLRCLFDHFGIARADVVGHSFGGRVALTFAAYYPEMVRNLVIADTQLRALQPPMQLADWPQWPRWKRELQALGLREPPSDDSIIDYKLLAELSQTGGDLANTGHTARQRISLRSRDMGLRGTRRWLDLLQNTSAGQDFEDETPLDGNTLSSVSARTLLMFGEWSHCIPTAHGLLRRMPDARLVVVPAAGHFFPAVKPALFARALMGFLDRDERPPRVRRRARHR